MKIGRITLSDRASNGVYEDKSGPEIEKSLAKIFEGEHEFVRVLIPDEPEQLRAALVRLCDEEKCPLVVTTGGTGPAKRDITPETTRLVLDRELPGFGEIMRYYSYERVPTAILSRATAGIRGQSLIINLPGRPRAVWFCLKLLREAMAEGLEHITGVQYELKVDPIVVPIEKFLPFLKWLHPKPDPREKNDPRPPLTKRGPGI
jgi:molybdopterin adenylyltransferase